MGTNWGVAADRAGCGAARALACVGRGADRDEEAEARNRVAAGILARLNRPASSAWLSRLADWIRGFSTG